MITVMSRTSCQIYSPQTQGEVVVKYMKNRSSGLRGGTMQTGATPMDSNSLQSSQTTGNWTYPPYDLAIPLLGTFPKEANLPEEVYIHLVHSTPSCNRPNSSSLSLSFSLIINTSLKINRISVLGMNKSINTHTSWQLSLYYEYVQTAFQYMTL